MLSYTDENFEVTTSKIVDLVKSRSTDPAKKGKLVAKLIELLLEFMPEYKINESQQKILTHYKVRMTRSTEKERKQLHIGDFNMESSESFQLISSMSPHRNHKMIEGMVKLIIQEEKNHGNDLKPSREVFRSRPGLYKFMEKNIDVFRRYFEVGTKVIADS